jgi:hypothetical protein
VIDNETLEGFLIRMDRPVETLEEGLWKISDSAAGLPPIVVKLAPPIVYVRLKVMSLPAGDNLPLFRRLLELNASGVAFGAYAVDDGDVYLVDTLRADSLQYSDLQTSIESLIMAAVEHYRELQPLVRGGE